MTFIATHFSNKRGIVTVRVEAHSENEARQIAAKRFGIRAHIYRIEIKAEPSELDQ